MMGGDAAAADDVDGGGDSGRQWRPHCALPHTFRKHRRCVLWHTGKGVAGKANGWEHATRASQPAARKGCISI